VIAGVAALGDTCGYIGKVANNEFGERFRHDLRSFRVELDLALAQPGEGATTSLSPVTHSCTMATYLGDSNRSNASDIKDDLIAVSRSYTSRHVSSTCRRRKRAIEQNSGAALAERNRKAPESWHAFSILRDDLTPLR